jgi:hypothetical protein
MVMIGISPEELGRRSSRAAFFMKAAMDSQGLDPHLRTKRKFAHLLCRCGELLATQKEAGAQKHR